MYMYYSMIKYIQYMYCTCMYCNAYMYTYNYTCTRNIQCIIQNWPLLDNTKNVGRESNNELHTF